MPRKARLDAPGALHHIMVRGIDKTNIFVDHQQDELGDVVVEIALCMHHQSRRNPFRFFDFQLMLLAGRNL